MTHARGFARGDSEDNNSNADLIGYCNEAVRVVSFVLCCSKAYRTSYGVRFFVSRDKSHWYCSINAQFIIAKVINCQKKKESNIRSTMRLFQIEIFREFHQNHSFPVSIGYVYVPYTQYPAMSMYEHFVDGYFHICDSAL